MHNSKVITKVVPEFGLEIIAGIKQVGGHTEHNKVLQ